MKTEGIMWQVRSKADLKFAPKSIGSWLCKNGGNYSRYERKENKSILKVQ